MNDMNNRKVTCIQVVADGRIFSGSLDCRVKLFSKTGEQMRVFPSSAADATYANLILIIFKFTIIMNIIIFIISCVNSMRIEYILLLNYY